MNTAQTERQFITEMPVIKIYLRMRRITPIAFLLGLSFHALAQDNHYEFLRMGSRNSILSNAGISRFEDQSAVIINPATLSFANNSSFTFNTTAVGTSTIKFNNGLGQGFDIRYGNLTVLPNMAAGVIKPKSKDRDWVLGYGIYHRMNDKLRFADRTNYAVNVINDTESPGNESYLAQYNLAHDLDEVTAVLGMGWNLNEHFAFGISQYFTYRSEEYDVRFAASALPFANSGATMSGITLSRDFHTSYFKVMAQTKLGIAWNLAKWDIGISAMLPSLGIMGKGDIYAKAQLTNARAKPTDPRRDYYANGYIEEQKSRYKYPLALSFGVSRPLGNVRMYGAVNYYNAVRNYNIMDPGTVDFIQPANDSNVLYSSNAMRVAAGNQQVINGSLGADWEFKANKHMLFSVHTDKHFSNIDTSFGGNYLTVKNWDYVHVGMGISQSIGRSDWVIGLRYSFGGKDDALQPYSFDDPSEGNYLQGDRQRGKLTATSFQLMISYAFRFK
jgi:hypothetical protein